jgi:hypothetical protein
MCWHIEIIHYKAGLYSFQYDFWLFVPVAFVHT